MSKKMNGFKIKVTDVSLRDTQITVYKNYLSDDNYFKFLSMLDEIGFDSIEAWGGGSFESQLLLKIDPWEKLKKIRAHLKNTRLQILMRGQNIIGYKPYPDDILEEFIKTVIEIGVDRIRIFDGLNDIRNVAKAIHFTKKHKAEAQIAVSYSNFQPNEYYIKYIREVVSQDIKSIYIKDSAGVMTPERIKELISIIKDEFPDIEIGLHSHIISGEAQAAYTAAINSGIDSLDFSFQCFSIPLGLPSIKDIMKVPENADLDIGIDIEKYDKLSNFLISQIEIDHMKLPKELIYFQERAKELEMPRGEIFYVIEEIKRRNIQDKIQEVLEEIIRIKKDIGNPPMLMPVSHIVSAQALINVITNERYKLVSKEFKNYFNGYYGKIPENYNKELTEKIIKIDTKSEMQNLTFAEIKEKIPKKLITKKEDFLTYSLFPNLVTEQEKADKTTQPVKEMILGDVMDIVILKDLMEKENIVEIKVEDIDEKIHLKMNNGNQFNENNYSEEKIFLEKNNIPVQIPVDNENWLKISTPLTGTYYITPSPDSPPFVKENDIIEKDKTICIIEAMKVMNEIKAPYKLKIEKIILKNGNSVKQNDELFLVSQQ